MNVFDAIKGRRSVRRFHEEKIAPADIECMIEAAVWAPSGGNAQSWRFVIVQDEKRIRRLRMVSPGMPGPPPCVIAICQDVELAERLGARLGCEKLTLFDSAMAAQNLLLTAHAVGLGTCVVASFHAGSVKSVLGLPESVEPILLVAVGRPSEEPSPPNRRREGIVFYETYS
ncbi:nitroreductase family protein [Candidatus Bipolaricaulota bacterium]